MEEDKSRDMGLNQREAKGMPKRLFNCWTVILDFGKNRSVGRIRGREATPGLTWINLLFLLMGNRGGSYRILESGMPYK